jgi:hypothetical protein
LSGCQRFAVDLDLQPQLITDESAGEAQVDHEQAVHHRIVGRDHRRSNLGTPGFLVEQPECEVSGAIDRTGGSFEPPLVGEGQPLWFRGSWQGCGTRENRDQQHG